MDSSCFHAMIWKEQRVNIQVFQYSLENEVEILWLYALHSLEYCFLTPEQQQNRIFGNLILVLYN